MTSSHFFIKKKDLCFPRAFLEGDEHHHLCRVLRVRPGTRISLFDEDGRRYRAVVERPEKDRTVLQIEGAEDGVRAGTRIALAQSLLKARAMEDVIRRATELGAAALIPVRARRSVARIEGEAGKKVERWRRIALEAAKQCKISYPPDILPISTPAQLAKERQDELKLLLSENGGRPLGDFLLRDGPKAVLLAVGPEGGWEPEEESLFLGRGFEAVSLGRYVLRAETAALAGLALISHFWDR